jgi:hypothetical protein
MITLKRVLDNNFAVAILPVILCLFLAPPHNFTENFTIVRDTKDFKYYDFLLDQMNETRHMGFPEASHENKMEVRILIPLILRYLYIFDVEKLPIFIYFINLICLYLFSRQLIRFQQEKMPNLKPLWLTPLLFTSIYTGISFVMDYWPMFDGIAFMLVAYAMNSRSFSIKTLLLLCSLFIDERSIFGAGMIFLIDMESNYWKPLLHGFILIISYVLIRMLLTHQFGLNSVFQKTSDLSFLKYINKENFNFFIIALINCFKGLWSLPVFLFLRHKSGFTSSGRLIYAAMIIIFLGSLLGSLLVADFTRSFSYGYPFFLYTVYYLYHCRISINSINLILHVLIITNILTVTYYFHSENEIYNTTDLFTKIGISLMK